MSSDDDMDTTASDINNSAAADEEQEEYLTYVQLSDDNKAILLNGKYSIKLPRDFSKKKIIEQRKIAENLIYNESETIDYGSPDNVAKLAKEVVDAYHERKRAAKKEDTITARIALQLARAHSRELFLNEFGRAFAAMQVNGHVEVHPMDERRFRNWLCGIYYRETSNFLTDDAIKKIVSILTAEAEFNPDIRRHRLDVRVRGCSSSTTTTDDDSAGNVGYVGENDDVMEDFDVIYYDLTNNKWEAIKITPQGWDIDRQSPILFRRYGSEKPQPYPDRNYELNTFDNFLELLNLKPERREIQKQLLKPNIVTMFWPNTTPKPILILVATQGSAKTTGFELIRDLVDPNTSLTASLPREDVNLKQSLAHNYVSFFDNVSNIKEWQSDVLCRAITGASDMKRELYENDKDIIYRYRRIVGLNGITNAATKPDLLDRGFLIEFGDIAPEDRELLRVIWRKYLELKPKLLAFCFDVISDVMAERQRWKGIDEDYFGMKELIKQKGGLPRMADWAILGEQVSAIIARKEGKPYTPGDFLDAFNKNLDILNTEALKSSLVAEALIAFMTEREAMRKEPWEGSATQLLSDLKTFIALHDDIQIDVSSRVWPQDPARLGSEIVTLKKNLAPLGIRIDSRRSSSNVIYTISSSELVKVPTYPTLPTHIRNEEKNVMNVGRVGSLLDLDADTLLQIAIKLTGDKGHFELKEWLGEFVFRPIQDPNHMNEMQADQTLQALIEEGKIEEFSPGKYRIEGGVGGGVSDLTTTKQAKHQDGSIA